MRHQMQTLLLEIGACHARVTTRLGKKAGPGQSCHINEPDHIQRNPGNHPRTPLASLSVQVKASKASRVIAWRGSLFQC